MGLIMKIRRYFKLYRQFVKQYIKSLIEYRADFVLGLIGFILVQFVGVIFIGLIFNSIPRLNGWNFYEVLFIYGLAQVPRGIDHVLTDNLWILSGSIIVEGKFDKYLIRPLNPLFQLLAERFQPDGFGEIIIGTILLAAAWVKLNIQFTFVKFLLLISVIAAATIIYTAIKLAVSSISFWVKFAQAYLKMAYSLSDFAKYPMNIYPMAIRWLLTFAIPFAFTGYFPGAYFLGKENILSGIVLTYIVSIAGISIAYFIWTKGMKSYESSGS